jgi:hypothetical protein
MFGTSGHVTQPSNILDGFTKSDPNVNMHVKAFVRPKKAIRARDPHSYELRHPKRYFALTGNRMPIGPFNDIKANFESLPGFIAHYYTQSETEFLRRKGRIADDGTNGFDKLKNGIHELHNEKQNTLLRDKYSHKIKEFLSYQ